MTKKYLIRAITMCLSAVFAFALPKTVKADALPCTVMYLNQAKAAQASAAAELSAAKSYLDGVQAKVNSLTASGETNTQAYFNAYNELLAAKGNFETKQQRLASANSYVSDCQSKYAVEDNADKSFKALQSVNVMQAAKLEYDNAQNIAAAASAAVEQTKKAIAGYKTQLASSPAVQAQIDALNSQLAAQQADLAAKQAVADSKKAVYAASLNSDYASYKKSAIDYIYNRDNMRDRTVTDLNKDGVVNGEDFFLGVQYVQDGYKYDPIYRQDHYIEEARNYVPPVVKSDD